MKKRYRGTVTKCGALKTARVEIDRVFVHRGYGKIVKRTTVCHVHDETGNTRVGDVIEIVESRPRSRTKRWEVIGIGNG